jgi:hypothetical protein
VNSRLTEDFLACHARLPASVRGEQARRSYRLWRSNPSHSGVQFKRVHTVESIYPARVGLGWRALGLREGGTVTWFWIGSHAEHDALLARL